MKICFLASVLRRRREGEEDSGGCAALALATTTEWTRALAMGSGATGARAAKTLGLVRVDLGRGANEGAGRRGMLVWGGWVAGGYMGLMLDEDRTGSRHGFVMAGMFVDDEWGSNCEG
ncbi:hypothetical protein MRB53_024322 [Persea americana]|uniref:Uncharacterized protein n=1 Tax=Persea americana TaxID=3435 RepID=A0ACC2LC10_PERAE|nr:hypothetical protein MRB53_024322 [Persea americana]